MSFTLVIEFSLPLRAMLLRRNPSSTVTVKVTVSPLVAFSLSLVTVTPVTFGKEMTYFSRTEEDEPELDEPELDELEGDEVPVEVLLEADPEEDEELDADEEDEALFPPPHEARNNEAVRTETTNSFFFILFFLSFYI